MCIGTTTYTYPAFKYANPKVYIAVNGNRIKTYNQEDEIRAFLKDGTEFQLEFDNDSECDVKAEIIINGKSQSSALVLRAHQRYYLDRFIDEKKKFKFNTFLTGNDDIQTLKEIIAKNGKIEIKFYKEFSYYNIGTLGTVTQSGTAWPIHYYGQNTTDSPFNKWTNAVCYTDEKLDNIKQSALSELNTYMCSTKSVKSVNSIDDRSFSKPVEVETGRVEAGSKSKQEFTTVSKFWEAFPCATFNYHIMPESYRPKKVKKVKSTKKVIVADDIRTYCNNCGRRIKKGWNFCAGCGEKF